MPPHARDEGPAGRGQAAGRPAGRPEPQRFERRLAVIVGAAGMLLLGLAAGPGALRGRATPSERMAVPPDAPFGAAACAGARAGACAPQSLSPTRLQAILAKVKALRSRIHAFSAATDGYADGEGDQVRRAMRGEILCRTVWDLILIS